MNDTAAQPGFPATVAEALARVAAVDLEHYAGTRNALGGTVSRLSPYITHGMLTLRQIATGLAARQPLDVQHKFVAELGWRAYYRHVWQHRGDAIFSSLHRGLLADSSYTTALPDNVRHACSGVPVIDQAVRQLYATGYLHNHVRLWLASYLVHVRKLHWRTGADWLYSHLLDGDLASNHLSWQWVAGTGSSKPYLFNAENVERFAPAPWHSRDTVIDASYETLDAWARDANRRVENPRSADSGIGAPRLSSRPPAGLAAAPDASQITGRDVWLVHPWALRTPPQPLAPGCLRLGIIVSEFHARWPWSANRWQFVAEGMRATTDRCWEGDAQSISTALRGAHVVNSTREPHLRTWLPTMASTQPEHALFPDVDRPCASFSQWWDCVTKGLREVSDLLVVVRG